MKFSIERKNIGIFIVLILLLLFSGFMILNSSSRVDNYTVFIVFTFYINILLFLFNLLKEIKKRAMSMSVIFYIFSLYFCGFAPLLQYYTDIFPWTYKPSSSEIITNNCLIFLWTICFIIGRNLKIKFIVSTSKNKYRNYISDKKIDIVMVVAIITAILIIKINGLSNMFFRASKSNMELSQTVGLILDNLLRSILLFSTVFSILYYKQKKKLDVRIIIILGIFVITCFPTSLARNRAAVYYGGLYIVYNNKILKNYKFSIAMILGLVIVFPLMGFLRSITDVHSGIKVAFNTNIMKTYLSGDYDAYTMFMIIRQYVKEYGVTYGGQLIGVLLFFVPRKYWPSKPLGTGYMAMYNTRVYDFYNVSAPLVSEAYVNFGKVGIVIFGIALGYLTKILDDKFIKESNHIAKIKIIYPFLMFHLFFILRGDLLSSWAYIFVVIVTGIIMQRLFTSKKII